MERVALLRVVVPVMIVCSFVGSPVPVLVSLMTHPRSKNSTRPFAVNSTDREGLK